MHPGRRRKTSEKSKRKLVWWFLIKVSGIWCSCAVHQSDGPPRRCSASQHPGCDNTTIACRAPQPQQRVPGGPSAWSVLSRKGLGEAQPLTKGRGRYCLKDSKPQCGHHCISVNVAPTSGLSWGNGSACFKSSFLCFQMGPLCSRKYMDFVLIISSQRQREHQGGGELRPPAPPAGSAFSEGCLQTLLPMRLVRAFSRGDKGWLPICADHSGLQMKQGKAAGSSDTSSLQMDMINYRIDQLVTSSQARPRSSPAKS